MDWEVRNKTVSVHRRHDSSCRISGRIDNKFLQLLSDYSKVQDTRLIYKVNCFPICQHLENEIKIKNTIPLTINLNVKCKIIKPLEEYRERKLR